MTEIISYKLNEDVTKKQLYCAGFKKNCYITYLYKNIIALVLKVEMMDELDDKYLSIAVKDMNTGQFYSPFYNNEYGRNEVLSKVINKYNQLMDALVIQGVLVRGDEE